MQIVERIYKKLNFVIWGKFWLLILPAILTAIYSYIIPIIIKRAQNVDLTGVIYMSGWLIIIMLFGYFLNLFMGITVSIHESNCIQKCKIDTYNQFINRKYNKFYNEKYGECKEHFADDFNTIMDYYLWEYPNMCVSIIIMLVYFIMISINSLLAAFTILIMSIVQLIVPIIINKYLQANYNNMREVEAEVTNYIVSSYKGCFLQVLFGKSCRAFSRSCIGKFLKVANA